jgi:elongation factor Ts
VTGVQTCALPILINFVRFEVGEGIEKKTEDFAAEVAAQMEAAKK